LLTICALLKHPSVRGEGPKDLKTNQSKMTVAVAGLLPTSHMAKSSLLGKCSIINKSTQTIAKWKSPLIHQVTTRRDSKCIQLPVLPKVLEGRLACTLTLLYHYSNNLCYRGRMCRLVLDLDGVTNLVN